MRFLSDNAARVCPEVMAALADANQPDGAYDGDALSQRLDAAFSDLFDTPCAALWVSSGTAANALALAAMVQGHQAVICHEEAHIQVDECGAPEFYTGGAKLMLAKGSGAKLDPAGIAAFADTIRTDVHQTQPAALSITNATEYGLVYAPDEVAALGALANARGWGLHMDGARFANAVATLGCSPADLTWKGGVDALSFGFVKNGGMFAEALVFFRPELADATRYRRKRAGHLLSKGRFAAAQILAMLEGDLWLRNARAANAAAAHIANAAGERLLHPVEANEIFLRVTAAESAALRAQGFLFHDWVPGVARLVCSWDQPAAEVEALARAIAGL
ncbi:threonine aldolase family protein [Rhizorhabdus dicambivorans]|uniref:Low specificity L-threonine aldolase n=1 Tax=Rhizorhabdus dicambivorans TaxID=1850238 RepID=A0A2A4G0D1_9SPHN|nr:beta-eliminating lyase-related protein [Rhizorhabdus dicambivorans]ATE63243.1 low specificity L-threonine aldolase [Rhizorhabdus dicambivorans]PCE43455.1 low specificity L-threonine aldolase [Rhizorhabdus dicambivorans]